MNAVPDIWNTTLIKGQDMLLNIKGNAVEEINCVALMLPKASR